MLNYLTRLEYDIAHSFVDDPKVKRKIDEELQRLSKESLKMTIVTLCDETRQHQAERCISIMAWLSKQKTDKKWKQDVHYKILDVCSCRQKNNEKGLIEMVLRSLEKSKKEVLEAKRVRAGVREGFATGMVIIVLLILSMLVAGMYALSFSTDTAANIRHIDTRAQLKLSETTSRVRAEIIKSNEQKFASGMGYARSSETNGRLSEFEDDFLVTTPDEEYRIVVEVFDVNKDSLGGGIGAPGAIRHPDPAYRERKRFILDANGKVTGS